MTVILYLFRFQVLYDLLNGSEFLELLKLLNYSRPYYNCSYLNGSNIRLETNNYDMVSYCNIWINFFVELLQIAVVRQNLYNFIKSSSYIYSRLWCMPYSFSVTPNLKKGINLTFLIQLPQKAGVVEMISEFSLGDFFFSSVLFFHFNISQFRHFIFIWRLPIFPFPGFSSYPSLWRVKTFLRQEK